MEFIEVIANIIGVAAVAVFLLSYLQKRRTAIITLNAISRGLYIVQYILLGAFSGMVLDIAGIISSLLAQTKNTRFVKKHLKLVLCAVNLMIVATGAVTIVITAEGESLLRWQTLIDILPIIGVLLHTGAFWIDDEKIIRRVSMLGSPFWFAYNLISKAYGSCIGDLLSMVSIGIAMVRYDYKKKEK